MGGGGEMDAVFHTAELFFPDSIDSSPVAWMPCRISVVWMSTEYSYFGGHFPVTVSSLICTDVTVEPGTSNMGSSSSCS